MSPITVAVITFVSILGGTLLGWFFCAVVPEQHLNDKVIFQPPGASGFQYGGLTCFVIARKELSQFLAGAFLFLFNPDFPLAPLVRNVLIWSNGNQ